MDIESFIENYLKENIVTETEVRTKFANTLFDLLDYPTELRAEEYPIYANDGRTKLHSKSAD